VAHLDENALSAYARRELSGGARAAAEDHLRTCPDCRSLLEDLAALCADPDADRPAPAATPPAAALPSGTAVGRYVILRPVGAGGFGEVHAAYDPTLDRVIALKLLRAGSEQDRLLREAQAMARLSHPNVVHVFDVAALQDRICVAMELIEGRDLRQWLAEGPRSWREVVDAFAQAGAGLAAAHAAGLVHRDFKPANVLIGKDGRVSVTDFGLARLERGPRPAPAAEEIAARPEALLDLTLTSAGMVVGTPAYMAPEQHEGQPGGARADQFAFCVALHEALFGQHPFRAEGEGVAALIRAVRAGERREPPASSAVPGWLRRAVQRGLSRDPQARWPSMDALLREISVAPRERRQRLRLWAAGLLLLSAIPAARVYDLYRQRAGLCTGAAAKVDEVWGEARRAGVQQAFAASGQPRAEAAFAAVDRALSGYLARWAALFTESCEETRLRGEQSEQVMAARLLCLERARTGARTLARELSAGDADVVEHAPTSAAALPDLEECRSLEGLLLLPTPPAGSRAAIDATFDQLAEVKALRAAGRADRALALGGEALKAARQLQYAPLLAEALLVHARGLIVRGDAKGAEAELHQAIQAAAEGRFDRIAAEAWVALVALLGVVERDLPRALALEEAARAAVARTGQDRALEAELCGALGMALLYQGRANEALAQAERALALGGDEAAGAGPRHARVAEALRELGRTQEAEVHARRAVELIERESGADHPLLALPLEIAAEAQCARGEASECFRLIRRAGTLRAGRSAEDPALVPELWVLADALEELRRPAEVRPVLEKAVDLARRGLPPGDPLVALADARLAKARGEPEALRRAVAALERAEGPEHPDVARARDALGEVLRARSDWTAARAEHARALALLEAREGGRSPLLARPLVGLAACEARLGRADAARAALRRALAVVDPGEVALAGAARRALEALGPG
jgi:eukaryotic-like serine/threonine-protein kinase